MQSAAFGGLNLAYGFFGLADHMRLARRHDGYAVGTERYPWTLPDSETASTPQDVMDRDRVKRIEGKAPTTLDLAYRRCMQADRQGDEQTVEEICLHVTPGSLA